MSEAKLAKIIQSDPTLVRRASDIEVDEVTLTGIDNGALGAQANAVVLLKQADEQSTGEDAPDGAVTDEVADESVVEELTANEEVAVLEKEDVTEEVTLPEIDFDSAVAFIRKSELTDDQKTSLVDVALELNQAADIEKSGNDEDISATIETVAGLAFPAEAMEMLKSISDAISKISVESMIKVGDSTLEEKLDSAIKAGAMTPAEVRKEMGLPPLGATKSTETNTEDIVVPSLADSVGMRLLKAQEERRAQGRAEQDASLLNAVSSLSASLSDVAQKLEASGQKLSRACGQDA